MSSMLVSSNLYVTCKNQDQCIKLIEQFENENPASCNFCLEQSETEPLRVDFWLNDGEVSSDFDDRIIRIDQWFRSNFGIHFEGYWWSEIECQHYRSEIHDGKIREAFLDWLEPYTVEQIEQIRQYAENTFS